MRHLNDDMLFFSFTRSQEVLNRNGIDKFAKLLRVTKHQSLRVSALWGLKNMTFSTSLELKMKVVATLGWDEIYMYVVGIQCKHYSNPGQDC